MTAQRSALWHTSQAHNGWAAERVGGLYDIWLMLQPWLLMLRLALTLHRLLELLKPLPLLQSCCCCCCCHRDTGPGRKQLLKPEDKRGEWPASPHQGHRQSRACSVGVGAMVTASATGCT